MTELRDYLKAYWQQRWMIIAVVVVATAATIITVKLQPIKYASSESFAINPINRQTTADYQYGGYYSLQAADLFAQTAISWFSTPSVLRDVYTQAKLNPDIKTVDSLPARFKVKKYSSQNIVVRFSESTRARATDLSQAIRDVMEQRASRLNLTADNKPLFEVVGTDPVIAPAQPSWQLWGLVALVLSFGFSLTIAALRFYMKSTPV
jgi:uncharacterized protein involved in exopolysaccharide biosynthesis